jgi:hypothetical protein
LVVAVTSAGPVDLARPDQPGTRPRPCRRRAHARACGSRARFHEIQIISVFAVETDGTAPVRLNPQNHSEYEWLPYEAALERVHYRGLKDGLRSTYDYIVGVDNPAPELRLR